MTGFELTFVMAASFLVLCTFAGLLIAGRERMRAGWEAQPALVESTS